MRGGRVGVGGVMNDLLVWHYWAIPHREKKRRGEERRDGRMEGDMNC